MVKFGDAALSPEQQVMREEMEAGMHKRKPEDPSKLGDVLDGMMGSQPEDADVSRMAHLLIEEHGQGLFLDIGGWSLVQRIVEAAVRVDPQDL